jgi:protein-S-isoprenylcysteine O-methyltransferase Ste14
MTETRTISPDVSGNRIFRFAAFLYGLVAYLVFFAAFLYAVGFVTGLLVPKTIDDGRATSVVQALIIDLLLMTLFAVQHSLMARRQFKQWWTQFVPKAVERSTYVLFASLTLILLFWQWRPMPEILWHIEEPEMAATIRVLSFGGWLVVLSSTFLINHFRAVRIASGHRQFLWSRSADPALPDAALLQIRTTPDLSGLCHRVFGGAHDERGPFVVRRSDHRVHLRRHFPGRARPGGDIRRRIPPLQGARVDAAALALPYQAVRT